jgi:hypothetical protein
MRNGLIQFAFVQFLQLPKHLLMDSVEHGSKLRLAWVFGYIGVGDRFRPKRNRCFSET